ncbi:hypothetical protein A1O7_08571 [Cladophialophora yegresii CBS 114405]|uniref:Uncharacterized protein n=1 Tax=Cladophialophora yegresii CBS 114405 TaxID=1182544 RepID=W9VIX9_9EURO|nr:uncharacterized protein A1O7_08571 [Cladophialophora yegresii CBS 114405]EXJ55642.1 hypothetical protein A1O7_08571 [Cladophialophora yegresii CBS 114405]
MKSLFSRFIEQNPPGGFPSTQVAYQSSQGTATAARAEDQTHQDSQEIGGPDFPGSPSDARKLHVQYDDYWNLHTTIHVTTANNTNPNVPTELYTIDARHRKPQMRIRSPAQNIEVATVVFHMLKTRIDVTLRGRQFSLESARLNMQYSYTSRAMGGEKLTWRPRKKLDPLNMVLLNGRGVAIARFKPEYWGSKRGGLLELLPECWTTDDTMEEVLVVALAVVHWRETQRITSAN